MDAVAAKAGVSKPTIYSHFDNKDALFAVVVEKLCDELTESFAPQDIKSFAPQKALTTVGYTYGDMLLAANTAAAFRMVISQSDRMRNVGQSLHAKIGGAWEQLVASYLQQQSDRGTIMVDDPAVGARQFLGMLKEWFLWPVLLGHSIRFPASERKRVVAHTVKTFLSATDSENT